MATSSCTGPRRTTPPSARNKRREGGFTLVELLVAMALFLVILTIAFNAFVSSNKLVEADTGRVMANQNVQTALDLMAADVRQAGENLELNLGISGIEFDDVGNTLTVRRSIPPLPSTGLKLAQLPLCYASGTTLQVVGPPPGTATATARCTYSDGDADGEHDNITPWRTYFTAQEGRPQAALLYRPKSGSTPALIQRTTVRSIEAQTSQTISGTTVRRVNVTMGAAVPVAFTPANNSLLILVDERRYVLVGDELRLALGGQRDDEAQPVAFDVTDLALGATLVEPSETVSSMALTGPWARVKTISLGLTANNAGQGRGNPRTYQATVFPRNVETARSTNAGVP